MRRRRHTGAQRHARIVRELGVPRPFSMSQFRLRLARYSARPVNIAPAELGSGSPSGFLFRKNGADFLFYEGRTSPYHQAHIVLHLAAHALLADTDGVVLDPRLVSAASMELARVMLGDVAPSQVSDAEADSFAFLALCPAGIGLQARRSLRRLEPLRRALLGVVPQAARTSGDTAGLGAARRLHQAVIEIREAALAMWSYRDPEVAAAATDAGRAAELAGAHLAAAVEAAVLAHAVQARQAGQPIETKPHEPGDLFVPQADLVSEAAWLVKVSRAFVRVSREVDSGTRRVQRVRPRR